MAGSEERNTAKRVRSFRRLFQEIVWGGLRERKDTRRGEMGK